jgi:hypothetical protein
MKYCRVVAGSVAAAAASFTVDTSAAAAVRAQQQQQRALQALLLACLKAAAAAGAAREHGESWGRYGMPMAATTVVAMLQLAKQQGIASGSEPAQSGTAAAPAGVEISCQDPAAMWMLLLARGLIVAGQLMQQQWQLSRGSQQNAVELLPALLVAVVAFRWLQQLLPYLQLPDAAAAGEQTPSSSSSSRLKQKLMKQAAEVQRALAAHAVVAEQGLQDSQLQVLQQQLAQQLQEFGRALCYVLPSKYCCNNPGCSNLARLSEVELVSGKGCVCSR